MIKTRLIWKPLKEWYKTFYTRPSMLWQYDKCPYKYKHWPKVDSDALKLGRYAHDLIQQYLLWNVSYSDSWSKCFDNDFSKDDKKLLWERLDHMKDEPKLIAAEIEWVLEVEMGNFLMVIPYHIDNDHWHFLSDLKTSKAEWNEDISLNYQMIAYCLWWYCQDSFDRDKECPFTFYVLTKHKRWARKQIVNWHERFEDGEVKKKNFTVWYMFDTLIQILKRICISENEDKRECYSNVYCKSCPLYLKCPLYTDTKSFIS